MDDYRGAGDMVLGGSLVLLGFVLAIILNSAEINACVARYKLSAMDKYLADRAVWEQEATKAQGFDSEATKEQGVVNEVTEPIGLRDEQNAATENDGTVEDAEKAEVSE